MLRGVRLFYTTSRIMDATRIRQPEWIKPVKSVGKGDKSPLRIYNSLTRNKEVFVPVSNSRVTWYSCGPTVYDESHLGHARNYVTTDINRRIMQDYFGYNVLYVQNVTDIDDKIIVRARQRYLFDEYSKKVKSQGVTEAVVHEAREALAEYAKKNLPSDAKIDNFAEFTAWTGSLDLEKITETNPKFKLHTRTVELALQALSDHNSLTIEQFLQSIEGVISPYLDSHHGSQVTDHQVFRDLASHFENDFNNDMRNLNVLAPSITTRVSEYIPEIITFVETIEKQGYAYRTTDGSVYFDTVAFEKSPNHDYAKLEPWNKGSQDLIDDAEGSLHSAQAASVGGKKTPADFALWKASKPGEPSWDSPFGGPGRPGWHIECSAMACHVCGPQIDIHSGGIDLAFPHHDNELAQSEAHFDERQWINYFMHNGHLHIEGQKMSKSLKNFITIKKALEMFTPRQLRLAFAFAPWNSQLDFRFSLPSVKSFESTLTNFFANTQSLARETSFDASKKIGKSELAILDKLSDTKFEVHEAFADSFNTPQALRLLQQLVGAANEYLTANPVDAKVEPVLEVARYVTRILSIIGLDMAPSPSIGWAAENQLKVSSNEEASLPYIQVLAKFREAVRSMAKASKEVSSSNLLSLSDQLRDVDLIDLGVALDDRTEGAATRIKFLSESEVQQIYKDREEAAAMAAEKEKRKAQAAAEREKQELERREKARVPASEMFRNNPEYSQWDSQGVPTHDEKGEPLSKSAIKKLQKQWAQQDKLHKQYNQ